MTATADNGWETFDQPLHQFAARQGLGYHDQPDQRMVVPQAVARGV
jgi:hypothetical protein